MINTKTTQLLIHKTAAIYMMKKRTHITFLGIIILLFSCVCNAQEFEQKFQFILDSAYQTNKDAVGFMIHVESPDKNISWTSAVGFSNKDATKKLNKNQPLLIASNTKTYVSAAILKLVENGKLKLSQSIKKLIYRKTKKLLKKSGYVSSKITVKHLLSHTSGITDYVDDKYFSFVNKNPDHKWTRDEQIQLAMKMATPIAAGKTYAYGDINYLLLTEIIERKTGKPFYIAIRDLLEFKKHNLNNTWFVDLEKKPTNTLPLAQQYSDKFNTSSSDLDSSWDLYGGGGLASNTKDLALFFQLLFEGKIIKNKSILSQMYTYVIPKEESKNYCLGLFNIPSFFGDNVYYHGGFWGTDVIYVPNINTTISIFTLVKEKRDINIQINKEIIELIKSQPRYRNQSQKEQVSKNEITTIQTDDYELIKSSKSRALLIVFPGGGSTSKQTKREFKIVEKAAKKGVSVLLKYIRGIH